MEKWSQADTMMSGPDGFGDLFTDQHGRVWHANVEIKSGAPSGPFQPVGWQAPLAIPGSYIKYVRGQRIRDAQGNTTRRGHDLEIEYDRWLTDLRLSSQQWYEDAVKMAVQVHGSAWTDRKQLPEDVRIAKGVQPGRIRPAVEAASQGQGYVLGKRPFDPANPNDVELRAILEPEDGHSMRNWLDVEPKAKTKVTV